MYDEVGASRDLRPLTSATSGGEPGGSGSAGAASSRALWDSEDFEQHFARVKEESRMKAQQAGVTVGEGREIRADEIELGAKLGEGQFARVYKATCRGQQVAVKGISTTLSHPFHTSLFWSPH